MDKLFLFRPVLKRTLWGGTDILRLKGLPPDLDKVGESWELSGMRGSESVVSQGSCAGMSLPQLVQAGADVLMGKENFRRHGASFPLLVKFIDACEDLSVQVHPNDELALRRHGCLGKTEMWYVVDAKPGAYLLSGFNRKITMEEYERHVADHTLPSVLCRHEAKAGDVFYLPAGRIHSIGAGCLICEIQQASDITYRIYDFGRTDAQGNPRQLHVHEAKEAIDFSVGSYRTHPEPLLNRTTELLHSPYFTTSLCKIDRPLTYSLVSLDSFVIVVCVRGGCTVRCGEEEVHLPAFHSLLASASCDALDFLPHGEADILVCHP